MNAAVDQLWAARRPLVISGRGARNAGPQLQRFLNRLGAVYLDTGESRGLIAEEHPSVVAAMRGTVLGEADVVVAVGVCVAGAQALIKLLIPRAVEP